MSVTLKYAAVLVASLLFLAVGFGLIVAAIWADFQPHEKSVLADAMTERAGLVFFMLIVAAVAIGLAIKWAFAFYVHPILRYSEDVRVALQSNPDHRLSHVGGGEFAGLVNAINELIAARSALRTDVEERIAEGRRSVEEERNRLAALMSELTQSVVVCNLDGRILLYNSRARLQFRALAEDPAAGGALIGLGRSIFSVFDRGLISHALENVQHRLRRAGSQPVAHFVTSTRAGQLIRVQMAPVLAGQEGEEGERQVTGYVLMLDNITRSFESEASRDRLLQELTEGSRAALGNIRAAVETLLDYPDMDAAQRERFVGVIGEEARTLSRRLDDAAVGHAGAMKARWPLEEMLGADLIQAAQRRIENRVGIPTKVEEVAEGLWIRVDSFSVLQALTYLSARLKDEYEVREVRFGLEPSGRMVALDLIWTGPVMGTETLMSWEMEPMQLGGEANPLTLRDVVERHGGELWFQRDKTRHRTFVRLLLPSAAPQESVEAATLVKSQSRPEYYDFDLFRRAAEYADLEDRPLAELAYTVFDTETTGLEPSAGDEIIQIGAVRVLNGRILHQESYEQLIDPRRNLSRSSQRVHGITPQMLKGQPTIDKVLPAFHAFCEDTVLVAHNAAFDLRFLQLKEEATGVRFTQPVLDTLLLSPVIHPNQELHKLEAIAERLGVNVIGRHTALGDAIVTGEVFLKMIPLLAEKGIVTLRQAREASQQTYYARVAY